MRVKTKFFVLLAVSLLLSACQQKKSYDYLMQHPAEVQSILGDCETSTAPLCETARRAEHDFQILMDDRDHNQQNFGKKILALEDDLVQKKIDLDNAKKTFKAHPEQTDLKTKIETLEAAYQTTQQTVNTLLAVVAAGGSPQ